MPINAVLIIDKPAGLTSHDVVHRVRRILEERSVGHLGTLDPMATGVLPLVIGKLTRLAQFYTGAEKIYEGEIRLGIATDTYDAEGESVGDMRTEAAAQLSLEQVRAAASRFVGEMQQVPPPFSAKKINGVPAYKLARKKREVQLPSVPVTVHEFEIHSAADGVVRFRVHVSAGTYVRTIAHELGCALGVGAHLASLRRIASGEFRIDDAHTLEQLGALAEQRRVSDAFIHPRRLLPDLPSVTATEQAVAFIRNGRAVNLPELSRVRLVKVFRGQTELIAIVTRIAGTLFQPKIVLI
jgi:tRNA pseudouridine55 synthase